MTCHRLTHMGKFSQDSKRSIKKWWIIRGRSVSESLGALDANPIKGLRTSKHFLEMIQHLLLGEVTNLSQSPFHRVVPSQSFNLWKLPPNWVDLKNPRGFLPKENTSPTNWQQGLFPQQTTDSPVWFCLSDYYKSRDHNSFSPVDYSTASYYKAWTRPNISSTSTPQYRNEQLGPLKSFFPSKNQHSPQGFQHSSVELS